MTDIELYSNGRCVCKIATFEQPDDHRLVEWDKSIDEDFARIHLGAILFRHL